MIKKLLTIFIVSILSISTSYADNDFNKVSKEHQKQIELYNTAIKNGTLSFTHEYQVYNSNTKIGYELKIGFIDDAQKGLFERWKRGDDIGVDFTYKEIWNILSEGPDDEMGLLELVTTEPYVTNQIKYSTEYARMVYSNGYPFYVIYLQPIYIKFGKPSDMAITDDRGPITFSEESYLNSK